MENDDFDKAAREALSFEPGVPSESVWRMLDARRRERMPSIREILISGFASAAALLVAWVVLASGGSGASPIQEGSEPTASFRAAIRDDAKLTLAAITKIDGI